MSRNVYLFQPNYRSTENLRSAFWLPYSVGAIWASAGRRPEIASNYRLKEVIARREPPEQVAGRLERPRIAAFSCYLWNSAYCSLIASRLKGRFPEIITIFGGPGVPDDFEEAHLRFPFADYCVHSHGEQAFGDLLEELLTWEIPADLRIPGVSHRTRGGAIFGCPAEKRQRLELLASPYLEGVFESLVSSHSDCRWYATLETSRGCPHSCAYCEWGRSAHQQVLVLPLERVCREIDWLAAKQVSYVYLADANFGALPDRDREIIDHLIQVKRHTGFPETVGIQWSKSSNRSVVELAAKLEGRLSRGMTLSVQSMSPSTLEAVGRSNLAPERFEEMLALCRTKKVEPYTELILGLPLESFESWRKGLFRLMQMGQHNFVEIWMFQLLENSPCNSNDYRRRYGIETRELEDYFLAAPWTDDAGVPENAEVIYQTHSMPHERLIESVMFSWMVVNFHYYGWLQIVSRALDSLGVMSYGLFYDAFWNYLKTSGSSLQREFERTRDAIEEVFRAGRRAEGSLNERVSAYFTLYDSQLFFHAHSDECWKSLDVFLDRLAPSIEIDRGLFSELRRFQRHFVTSPLRLYPYTETFAWDFATLLDSRTLTAPGCYQVQFDSAIPQTGWISYTDALINQRRHGAGRAVMTPLGDEALAAVSQRQCAFGDSPASGGGLS